MEIRDRLFGLTDRFLPEQLVDADRIRRKRTAIFQSWLGVFFTLWFSVVYTLLGSPWSGASIMLICLGSLITPFAVRRGASLLVIGNVQMALTYMSFCVVAFRSGGIDSPAIAWTFLLPPATYVACGKTSSMVWSVLSGLMIAGFFALDRSGVLAAQDFTPSAVAWLRLIGYLGILFSLVAILYVVERARLDSMLSVQRAQRALERERIVSDMHDGAGNQLLGLMSQVRAGQVDRAQLLHELEQCFADLRLTLDSLDAEDRPISQVLAESRARITRRCEASGIELAWHDTLDTGAAISARASSHIVRFLQESTGNALRHARSTRLNVQLAQSVDARINVSVRDFGVGFDPQLARGLGRGLDNLYKRAEALGGALEIQRCDPGVNLELSFPMETGSSRSNHGGAERGSAAGGAPPAGARFYRESPRAPEEQHRCLQPPK